MEDLTVHVLGCGPTGLLAAHGAAQAAQAAGRQVRVHVHSRRQPSQLYGCQYLHRAIPGLDAPHMDVSYLLQGSIEGYRRKVYGGEDVAVSPSLLETDHRAWDIRAAYAQLWEQYKNAVHDVVLTPANWQRFRQAIDGEHGTRRSLWVSSLPAPVLCGGADCTFGSQPVWAMGDAFALDRLAPEVVPGLIDGTVLCSGDPSDAWYRVSKVFGHSTVEWPAETPQQPPRGASRVRKPIGTTCQCNPDVMRVGRFGKWQKGVLADSAYSEVYINVLERLAD